MLLIIQNHCCGGKNPIMQRLLVATSQATLAFPDLSRPVCTFWSEAVRTHNGYKTPFQPRALMDVMERIGTIKIKMRTTSQSVPTEILEESALCLALEPQPPSNGTLQTGQEPTANPQLNTPLMSTRD